MKVFRHKQVVMLPTDNQSVLGLHTNYGETKLYLNTDSNQNTKLFPNWRPQHLYVISTELLKNGDWYLSPTNDILQATSFSKGHEPKGRKIIATTNNSLMDEEIIVNFPQLSKEWIKYFTSEYNRGMVITEIMVAYNVAKFFGEVRFKVVTNEELVTDIDNKITIEYSALDMEKVGKKAYEYCKKYEGTEKFSIALRAIEFGYQLAATT